MSFFKTLRARFALWTAGLLLAALLLFGLFVYSYMSNSLRSTVDDDLHSAATQLMDEGMRGGLLILDDLVEDPQYFRLNEQGLSVRLLSLDGTPLQTYGPSQNWPLLDRDLAMLSPIGELHTLADATTWGPVRTLSIPILKGGETSSILQIALTLRDMQKTMNLLFAALLIGVPLVALLAGGGGYFLAARALNPIDTVIRTARQISAQGLSGRLNLPTTDDEVGRLVATFDSMLERLDDAFRRERQFTGDASHELRTPLAAMQTIISSTLTRQRAAEEYQEALMDLGHEVEQMRSLTEGLLILARNDANHQPAQMERVDVALLLKDLVDSLRPLAEEKGLQLIDEVSATELLTLGNCDGLIRLFVNLVDNAIKYTPNGSVTVSTFASSAEWIRVTVRDTGMGIAPEHLPHIFDRFYRADVSRSTDGIGLGLAIAMNIARLHGGEIAVESEAGKGTIFQVTLPALN